MLLNASIVLYKTPLDELLTLLAQLLLSDKLQTVYLVDNSPEPISGEPWLSLPNASRVTYIFTGRNLGYGAAHNIAICRTMAETDLPYHLVLNSDLQVSAESLHAMLAIMQHFPEIALLQPRIIYPNGEEQFSARLLPTPFDVFGRRFLPKRWMQQRMQKYELREADINRSINAPYLSGCFMLLRCSALEDVGLFDERFFMYPEDIDLTRRLNEEHLTIRWPGVTIVHNHRQASYHSLRMLWIHSQNMCRYFNKWGWIFDSKRRIQNRLTLELLKD